MKKGLITILLFVLSLSLMGCNNKNNILLKEDNLFHDGLACVQSIENELYGYIDNNGNVVIDYIYDDAKPFFHGVAVVRKDETEYLIDKSGNKVSNNTFEYLNQITVNYDYTTWLDLYAGRIDGLVYLVNIQGEIISSGYKEISFSSSDNYIKVRFADEYKEGYIDLNGNEIKQRYLYANHFHDGLAKVEIDGKDYIINKNFEIVFETNEKYIYTYTDKVIVLKDDLSFEPFIVVDYQNNVIFDEKGAGSGAYKLEKEFGVKLRQDGKNHFYGFNGKNIMDIADYFVTKDYLFILSKDHYVTAYDKDLNKIKRIKVGCDVKSINGKYNDYNGKTYVNIMYDEKYAVNTVHYEFTNNKFKKLELSESYEIGSCRNKNYYILYDYDHSKDSIYYSKYVRYKIYNLDNTLIFDINPNYIESNSCPSILSDGYVVRDGFFDSKVISIIEGEKLIEVNDCKIRSVWSEDK